jgi:hypothetical protein
MMGIKIQRSMSLCGCKWIRLTWNCKTEWITLKVSIDQIVEWFFRPCIYIYIYNRRIYIQWYIAHYKFQLFHIIYTTLATDSSYPYAIATYNPIILSLPQPYQSDQELMSFNKVFNSLSLCFVYLVLFIIYVCMKEILISWYIAHYKFQLFPIIYTTLATDSSYPYAIATYNPIILSLPQPYPHAHSQES